MNIRRSVEEYSRSYYRSKPLRDANIPSKHGRKPVSENERALGGVVGKDEGR